MKMMLLFTHTSFSKAIRVFCSVEHKIYFEECNQKLTVAIDFHSIENKNTFVINKI